MAFVVAEPCVKCKLTDCVAVCPVDCFREADNYLVIDPDICIDCGACVPECPLEAIFDQDDLPAFWRHYIEANAVLSKQLPEIVEVKHPLPEADSWSKLGKGEWKKVGEKDKLAEPPLPGKR